MQGRNPYLLIMHCLRLSKKQQWLLSKRLIRNLPILALKDDKGDKKRRMGKCLIDIQFYDEDNVPILVSLNSDEDGNLFELDIWRADFKPVVKYPSC